MDRHRFGFFLPQLVRAAMEKQEKAYQKKTPINTVSGIEAQQFGQKFEDAELDFIRLEAK